MAPLPRTVLTRVLATPGAEAELLGAVHRVVETLIRDGFIDPAVGDDESRLSKAIEIIALPLAESRAIGFANIIGVSAAMRHVCEQVAQAARSSSPVLVTGEAGAGKELIVNAIHYNSPRARRALIKVDCAVPAAVLDAELFGEDGGGLTSARATRKGKLELADGGTLLLNGVGELQPSIVPALVHALRVRADVRVIVTARHVDGPGFERVREDFLGPLNPFAILVPPLRERQADIPILINLFVETFAREHNKRVHRVSTRVIELLTAYAWPGNVRELRDTVERAVVQCHDAVIHPHHLPASIQAADPSATIDSAGLAGALAAYERELLEDALKRAGGVRSRAARLLKTTERIFNYKLRRHGIDSRRFKAGHPRE